MVKISKLTDYGTILLAFMAKNPKMLYSAQELAELTRLPLPTVSKILKILAQQQIISSSRGAHGGYSFKNAPETLSIANIIKALEGPIAITECTSLNSHCEFEDHCFNNQPWHRINQVITHSLEKISLKDLIDMNTEEFRGKFYG